MKISFIPIFSQHIFKYMQFTFTAYMLSMCLRAHRGQTIILLLNSVSIFEKHNLISTQMP